MFNTGEAVILSEVFALQQQGKFNQAAAKQRAWDNYIAAMQVARFDSESTRSAIALDEYNADCEKAALAHPND